MRPGGRSRRLAALRLPLYLHTVAPLRVVCAPCQPPRIASPCACYFRITATRNKKCHFGTRAYRQESNYCWYPIYMRIACA
jgi:hypothetical protein